MYFYLWNQWQILPEKSLIRKYRLSFTFLLYSIYGYLSSPFWAIIFLFFLKSRVYNPYSAMKKFKTKK